MILAFFEFKKQYARSFIDDYPYLYKSKLTPGISILIPAYNEQSTIIDTARSLLSIRYPNFEIIVINDGSTDNTAGELIREFNLKKIYHAFHTKIKTKKIKNYYISISEPRLIVIDKVNGGKADSLNAGINTANYPYFISIDADVLLEEDAMLKVMKPLLENPKKNVVAGGIVRVINGCLIEKGKLKEVRLSRRPLPIFQVVEYLRAFTAGRAGFQRLKSLIIVSGAFSVFNIGEVRQVRGYDRKSIGEDMELIVRLHKNLKNLKKDYNFLYRAYPVCWTEVPENLKILGRQRNRWHRGLIDTLIKHKNMISNPRYGMVGMFGLPFFLYFEFLGPIIEIIGYLSIIYILISQTIDIQFFLLFLGLAVLWSSILSLFTILLEDIYFKRYKKWYYLVVLTVFSLFENFGYRHLTLIFRIKGFIDYLRKKKSWGEMRRTGFS